MAKGKAHSDETRAAVMAALLSGQGVAEVARQYQLPETTVRNWRNALPADKLAELGAKKGEAIDGLLFDYLSANLTALKEQAKVFSDPAYLTKQPADQAAVLHGVMADKAVRLLEAVEDATGDEQK